MASDNSVPNFETTYASTEASTESEHPSTDPEEDGGHSTLLPTISSKKFQLIDCEMQSLSEAIESVTTPSEAGAELEELQLIKQKFDSIIGESADPGKDIFEKKRQFLMDYRNVRSRLLAISDRDKRPYPAEAAEDGEHLLKLPAMDIPSFNGDVTKWASFKGIFLNLLSEARLKNNKAAKQHFLFQALTGDAKVLVENLQDTDFDVCWGIVSNFYDDPLCRSKAHFDALFKNSDPSPTLRQLLISFRQHISGMKSTWDEADLEPFEQVVIASFLDRASQPVRLAWERVIASDLKICTLNYFFKFIEQQCLAVERAGNKGGSTKNKQQKSTQSGNKGHVFLTKRDTPGGSPKIEQKSKFCKMCSSTAHFMSECPDFRQCSDQQRLDFIKQNELCLVCF